MGKTKQIISLTDVLDKKNKDRTKEIVEILKCTLKLARAGKIQSIDVIVVGADGTVNRTGYVSSLSAMVFAHTCAIQDHVRDSMDFDDDDDN